MRRRRSFFELKNTVLMALFAAFLCVLAPIAVPIGPVPITLTNFLLYIAIAVLGWKRTFVAYLVYLFVGIIGLPVFSGFEGGLGKIAGPTGGYLIGFFLMILIVSLWEIIKSDKMWLVHTLRFGVMALGTGVAYAFGTMWFSYSTGTGWGAALLVCVVPFLIGDFVKIVLALIVAPPLAKQMAKIN